MQTQAHAEAEIEEVVREEEGEEAGRECRYLHEVNTP